MIAEVQAEFKIFGAIVQKLELSGRPDGGMPANPVAGCLQIRWRDACKSGKKTRGEFPLRAYGVFVRFAGTVPCRFHCGFVQRPAFLQGAFTLSADGCRDFALRSPQGRSLHPQTGAAACAALRAPAEETFPRALFSPPRRRGRCCSQNRAIAARPRPWRCGP